MRITSLRLLYNQNTGPCTHEWDRYRLIMTVPSSMIQLFPITTGPVCPKITTFGWTTVPVPVNQMRCAPIIASLALTDRDLAAQFDVCTGNRLGMDRYLLLSVYNQ